MRRDEPKARASYSIFSAPRPFEGVFDRLQRNAIRTWTLLDPRPEVILLGDDSGVAEAARDFGCVHVPDIEYSPTGLPLVSSLFRVAHAATRSPFLVYTNADMMFGDGFEQPFRAVLSRFDRFLLVGQRIDVEIGESWRLQNTPRWRSDLQALAEAGNLHPPTGMDFFGFPRSCFIDVPDFAVGRPGWDNWMVLSARQRGIKVVDVTSSVLAVHQNHHFGSTTTPKSRSAVWSDADSYRNIDLKGSPNFHIDHANFALREGTITRIPVSPRRRVTTFMQTHPRLRPILRTISRLLGKVDHRDLTT